MADSRSLSPLAVPFHPGTSGESTSSFPVFRPPMASHFLPPPATPSSASTPSSRLKISQIKDLAPYGVGCDSRSEPDGELWVPVGCPYHRNNMKAYHEVATKALGEVCVQFQMEDLFWLDCIEWGSYIRKLDDPHLVRLGLLFVLYEPSSGQSRRALSRYHHIAQDIADALYRRGFL